MYSPPGSTALTGRKWWLIVKAQAQPITWWPNNRRPLPIKQMEVEDVVLRDPVYFFMQTSHTHSTQLLEVQKCYVEDNACSFLHSFSGQRKLCFRAVQANREFASELSMTTDSLLLSCPGQQTVCFSAVLDNRELLLSCSGHQTVCFWAFLDNRGFASVVSRATESCLHICPWQLHSIAGHRKVCFIHGCPGQQKVCFVHGCPG